jgi:TP901 family phage tail tape measure protein
MAASTREVFLLLKARDEASRVLRGFSSEVSRSGDAMRAAALRAQATAAQGEVVARRQASALMSQAIAEKILAAAANDKRVATARASGASGDQIRSLRLASIRLREEANEIIQTQRAYDKKTSAIAANIRMLDREATALEKADRDNRRWSAALMQTAGALATVAVGLGGVALAGGAFFYNAYQDWTEYSKAVALTKTQVDGFTASMQELSDIGMRVATEIPVAFEEIQPALFNIFSSTNANLKQSEILLEGFSKAAVAGQTDILTAAKGTIAIMNAYNIPLERVNDVLDIQFELVRKGVGTYEEFANVFGRVVPSAARAGQSFETIAAMLAIMTRNGQSAAMASTSAARAMDAFSHPKAIASLEKFGVKMKDAQGNMLPLVDILKDFRSELEKVPSGDRVAKIIEIFKGAGGTIQARRFIEQMLLRPGEVEEFEKMLESMSNATGVMNDSYSTMADTAAAKTQLMENRWMALKITMGQAAAPAILMIIDALSALFNWFNNLDPKTKQIITTVGLLAVGFTAVGAVVLGILAGFVMLAAAIAAITVEMVVAVAVLAGFGTAFAGVAAGVTLLWTKSEGFRNVLISWWVWLKKVKTEAWDPFAEGIANAWKTHMEPALNKLAEVFDKNLMPTMQEFHKGIQDQALPMLKSLGDLVMNQVVPAFKFVAEIIQNYVVPAIEDVIKFYKEHKTTIDLVVKAVLIFAAALAGTIATIILIAGVITALLIAGGIMMLIVAFEAIVTAIEWVTDAFDTLIGWVVSLYETIVTSFSEAGTAISDWFTNVVTWFEELPGKVWAAIQALPTVLHDAAVAAFDAFFYYSSFIITKVILFFTRDLPAGIVAGLAWIGQIIVDGWNAIVTWFSALPDRLGNIAGSIWTTITNWFNRTYTDVLLWVMRMINGITDWWNGLGPKVQTALSNFWRGVMNFFANADTILLEVGRNIIRGLINGIDDMVQSGVNAARRAVEKMRQGVEDALKMGSPSKVFAEIGKFSMLGYIQGIEDNVKAVNSIWGDALIPSSSMMDSMTNPRRVGAPSSYEPAFSTASRQNTITVNVYTNEIDPRTTATELGWELEGRLN